MVTNPKLMVRNPKFVAGNNRPGHICAASEISPSGAFQSNLSAMSPVHDSRLTTRDPKLPAPPLAALQTTNRNPLTTLSSTHPSPMIDEIAITATGYWLSFCSLFFSLPCSLLLRSLAPCFTHPPLNSDPPPPTSATHPPYLFCETVKL
jgi:hypothetical protein